ncbi:MAG TPA: DNA-3-methyladenine glycosylase [Bryobacteraceae bacterium]|nr:DNA-3-methyladenine glycosylase [Bryobacteraceae bacterium]
MAAISSTEPRAPASGSTRPSARPLSRSFYLRPTIEVARALLGTVIVHGRTSGRIVETEAYLGVGDGAAHTARGPTPRTQVIFGPPGHAYVYLIYGMYECLNLVCEPDGIAGCVLIRAVEPLEGLPLMRRRRPAASRIEDLANGPGKLTRALGIDLRQNGVDVTRGPLLVSAPPNTEPVDIAVSRRIGITKSPDLPLRFFIRGNRFVSSARSLVP